MKGLLVFELHRGSQKKQEYILTGEFIPQIFESSTDTPELILAKKKIGSQTYRYCYPIADKNKAYICATGNFVTSSDSRFPNEYPIPLHRNQPNLF